MLPQLRPDTAAEVFRPPPTRPTELPPAQLSRRFAKQQVLPRANRLGDTIDPRSRSLALLNKDLQPPKPGCPGGYSRPKRLALGPL